MIQSLTPVSSNALGALAIIGGGAENASTDRASSSAAQEFAALLGAAMQQPKANAKVPLTAIADATFDTTTVATTDEEQATEVGGSEIETLYAVAPTYVPIGTTTVSTATTATTTKTASDDETAGTDAVTTDRAHGARGNRRVARTLVPAVNDRSTDALDSDFSARLTRVLDAMRDAGYDVEVVETTRTQERQDALFAQGRTTLGPVVTWTRDSRHLTGDAADVRIDGKMTGPGYALFHQLAKDEGLRTLGARDPGHIELPRTTVDAKDGAAARRGGRGLAFGAASQGTDAPASPARTARLAATARVAPVARVAEVARPAKVAEIAGVHLDRAEIFGRIGQGARVSHAVAHGAQMTAQVQARASAAALALGARVGASIAKGEGSTATTTGPQQADTTIDAGATTRTVDAGASGERDANAQNGANGGTDARGAASEQNARGAEARAARATRLRRQVEGAVGALDSSRESALNEMRGDRGDQLGAGSLLRTAASRHAGATTTVTAAGQLATARAEALLDARDAAPAPTIGELRLAFDQSRDGLSEVRLAVDGAALDATLRTSDIGVARGLQGEVASLARALEKHGFDTARVAVALESAQQSRATALDTVAATESTARDRALRGDGSAAREGRDQQATSDTHREQQHARRFGSRRQH